MASAMQTASGPHVHANGRVYDPALGRFLSVDPVFQSAHNGQSLNPYSYVMNNPLSMTDPTGYTGACTAAASGENTGTSCQDTGLKPGDTTSIQVKVSATEIGSHITEHGTATMTGVVQKDGSVAVYLGSGSTENSGNGSKGQNDTDKPGANQTDLLGATTRPNSNNPSANSNQAPVSQGNKAVLTDKQIGNIIFNETKSLSGPYIEQGREVIANTIINGDEKYGGRRPDAASAVVDEDALSKHDKATLSNIRRAVTIVREERSNGIDGAHGATEFGLRDLSKFTKTGWVGLNSAIRLSTGSLPIHGSEVGPFKNSFPTDDLGKTDIYLVLFHQP